MPNGSGGAGSLMPSCVSRCSAVTGRELSAFKIFSFGPVFIDLAPAVSVDRPRSYFSRCAIGGCAVTDGQRPTKSPKRFSASPGLQKPRSSSVLILCCVAGRPIEATQAFHPDSISISGGKLATSTRRLVSMIVCLSKEAIRVASASTNLSRSASGNDQAPSQRQLQTATRWLFRDSQNACRKQVQARFPYQSLARESVPSTRQMHDSDARAFPAMDASLWIQEGGAPNRQALQGNLNESERNLRRRCQRQPP